MFYHLRDGLIPLGVQSIAAYDHFVIIHLELILIMYGHVSQTGKSKPSLLTLYNLIAVCHVIYLFLFIFSYSQMNRTVSEIT